MLTCREKIKERRQRFRELCPDPGLRQHKHYAFIHAFLPAYVHRDPWAFFVSLNNYKELGSPSALQGFIQSRWRLMERMMDLSLPSIDGTQEALCSGMTDLCMWDVVIHKAPSVLIELPDPELAGQVYYVAAVLMAEGADPNGWSRQARARYFMLERATDCDGLQSPVGHFAERDEQDHYIPHESRVQIDLEVFRECVCSALAGARQASQ